MMQQDAIVLKPEDRLLFIINDNVISGSIRFQKYGFLLHKKHQTVLRKLAKIFPDFSFYDDWEPYNFGPYSRELAQDIEKCINDQILNAYMIDEEKNYRRYSLALSGRIKWRKIFFKATDEMIKINDKIKDLQTIKTVEMLKQIYMKYPEFAKKSLIRDSLN